MNKAIMLQSAVHTQRTGCSPFAMLGIIAQQTCLLSFQTLCDCMHAGTSAAAAESVKSRHNIAGRRRTSCVHRKLRSMTGIWLELFHMRQQNSEPRLTHTKLFIIYRVLIVNYDQHEKLFTENYAICCN